MPSLRSCRGTRSRSENDRVPIRQLAPAMLADSLLTIGQAVVHGDLSWLSPWSGRPGALLCPAPSEPDVPVSEHPAQASPSGS
jgi:hypothetical protein